MDAGLGGMNLNESVETCAAALRLAGQSNAKAAWIVGREAEALIAGLPRSEVADTIEVFRQALAARCPWWSPTPQVIKDCRAIFVGWPDPAKLPYGVDQARRLATHPELQDVKPDISQAEVRELIWERYGRRTPKPRCAKETRNGPCRKSLGHAGGCISTVRKDWQPKALTGRQDARTGIETPEAVPETPETVSTAEVPVLEAVTPEADSEVSEAFIVEDIYELEVGPLIAKLMQAIRSNPRDIAESSLHMRGLRDLRKMIDDLEDM